VNLAQAQAIIVAKAESLLGTPYVYGVTDCEWLTHTCAAAVGVTIPRGATEQYDALPHLTGMLEPGDLVYFHDVGDPPGEDHCGVFTGYQMAECRMIDAPHTGTVVRYDVFSTAETLGTLAYVGAVRVASLAKLTPIERQEMAKIFVAQGSTAPYLVGAVPVTKQYLPNPLAEALLGLGYEITRDVDPAWLAAVPGEEAPAEEVLPVAEPPAAEAPAEPEPETEVSTPTEPDVVEAPTEPEAAPDPLPKPGDPGWRQTA
jgi:hypothetical protein